MFPWRKRTQGWAPGAPGAGPTEPPAAGRPRWQRGKARPPERKTRSSSPRTTRRTPRSSARPGHSRPGGPPPPTPAAPGRPAGSPRGTGSGPRRRPPCPRRSCRGGYGPGAARPLRAARPLSAARPPRLPAGGPCFRPQRPPTAFLFRSRRAAGRAGLGGGAPRWARRARPLSPGLGGGRGEEAAGRAGVSLGALRSARGAAALRGGAGGRGGRRCCGGGPAAQESSPCGEWRGGRESLPGRAPVSPQLCADPSVAVGRRRRDEAGSRCPVALCRASAGRGVFPASFQGTSVTSVWRLPPAQ